MKKVKYYFQQFLFFLKNLFFRLRKIYSRKEINARIDHVAELRIKIEEVPNDDILIYHISDELTSKKWSFCSMNDLQFGGIYSVNYEKEEVPEELQHLAGAFLSVVKGLIEVDFSKYKIRLTKSPVFDWEDLENDVQEIIRDMIAKERRMVIKERVSTKANDEGFKNYPLLIEK